MSLALPDGTPRHLQRLPRTVLPGGYTVHRAATIRSRLRGLLGARQLPPRHALLLTRTRSVHTLGMQFALDLVWLAASGDPVRVDPAVPPGRQRSCRGARAVLEVPVGEGLQFAALAREGRLAMMASH